MEKNDAIRHALDGISNLMFYSELEFLYDIVHKMQPKTVLEIGSYEGSSARIILEACDCKITCVDNFVQGWYGEQKLRDALKGYKDRVRVIKCDSSAVPAIYEGSERPDLIFIDGCHRDPVVSLDIQNCIKLVTPGGTLCGHDYSEEFIDCKNAVDKHVGQVETRMRVWVKYNVGA